MHLKISTLAALLGIGLATWTAPAQAGHSWGDWHWERATNPVTLTVLDSTSDTRTLIGGQNWPAMLSKSGADWSASSVLDLALQPKSATDLAVQQACPFQPDAIRVCNVFNPDVTWLGLATVLPDLSSGGGHVLAATAQVNDTWFSTPLYNSTAAQHVMCQEVGHTFGLDHQSEDGSDLNTCMDYSEALDNPEPNAHDYAQLQTIYGHLDGSTSGGGGGGSGGKGGGNGGGKPKKGSTAATGGWSPAELGLPADFHGTGDHGHPHSDVFVTQIDGQTVLRYVLWAY